MTLHIYILSPGGRNLYTYKCGTESDGENPKDHLVSCVISGIVTAIGSITNKGKSVEEISLGDLKFHFKYGGKVWGFLISNKKPLHLKERLELLIAEFERKYTSELENWDGNRSKFEGTREIVEEIFCQIP